MFSLLPTATTIAITAHSYAGVSTVSTKAGHSFLRVDGSGNNLPPPPLPLPESTLGGSRPSLPARSGHGGDLASYDGHSQYSSFRRLAGGSYSSLPRVTPVQHVYSEPVCAPRLSDVLASLAVPREDITLAEKLHEGTFGVVYKGTYCDEAGVERPAMVKTISSQASNMQCSLFLTEGMFMYKLHYRHICSVIAVCMDEPCRPLLIYPLAEPGNLKLFLHTCKLSPSGQTHSLVTQDLVSMAIQIVKGIIYLHKHQKIHKDIAARNCAVFQQDDGQLLVKITDNALARDLFPNDYHCLGDNENRPVKWLAIESLIHKEFTQFSDVWAFGVCLWELMVCCAANAISG